MAGSRFYTIYINLLSRVYNKNVPCYPRYGGRGIKCLWKSFTKFKKDMYGSYLAHVAQYGEKNTTLDRNDNNGDYCKDNCSWKTRKEQANNTRRNRLYTFRGKSLPLREWAKLYGINRTTLHQRVAYGWALSEVLTQPIRPGKKLATRLRYNGAKG